MRLFQRLLFFVSILFGLGTVPGAWAQVTLPSTGTHVETFDGIGTALPTGWTVRTGAMATTIGTSVTYLATSTNWSETTGRFQNSASADNLTSSALSSQQSASTDRAITVRQGASFGDPGAAFTVQLNNTTGYRNFQLSFKLQSTAPNSGTALQRTTTWRVDYGLGLAPATFTTATTIPSALTTGNNVFSNQIVTVNFGTALDDLSGPVTIRLVTLTSATGSNNRTASQLDDFTLTYDTPPAITTNPTSLTGANGLMYTEGSGPASRTNSVSGNSFTSATGSVTVTTSDATNFAISSDGGTFSSSATLPYSTSTLSATTVTVRLASGLPVSSTYSTTLTFAGGGATATVPVTGTVNSDTTPFLTATPTSLTGFSTTVGTPSTTKTYALTAINLTGPVSISASTGYELSPDGITFTNTTTVSPVSGTVVCTVNWRGYGNV